MKSAFILALTASVQAGPLTDGDTCPGSTVMSGFDLEKYLGTWYEYRPSIDQPFGGSDCVKATYSIREDGLVKVLNSGQKKDPWHPESYKPRTYLEAKAKLTEDPTKGKLMVAFFGDDFSYPYDVIDTDFETYALVYGCRQLPGYGKFENAWVLTRDSIDSVEKRLDETAYKKTFEAAIPTFNYDKAFADNYSIQGMRNGCDGPMEEDKNLFLI